MEIKTKREAEIARRAFSEGIEWANEVCGSPCNELLHEESHKRYPDPVRPRVVTIDDRKYRVVDNQVEYRSFHNGKWYVSKDYHPSTVKAFMDLIANPTEPTPEGGENNA